MVAVKETFIPDSEREREQHFMEGRGVESRNVFLSNEEVISFQSRQSWGKHFLFV